MLLHLFLTEILHRYNSQLTSNVKSSFSTDKSFTCFTKSAFSETAWHKEQTTTSIITPVKRIKMAYILLGS